MNSETSAPMPSVNANPLTPAVANTKRMNAVSMVTTLASTIVAMPLRVTRAIAAFGSTARPRLLLYSLEDDDVGVGGDPDRQHSPAIPGRVSVIGMSLIRAKKMTP